MTKNLSGQLCDEFMMPNLLFSSFFVPFSTTKGTCNPSQQNQYGRQSAIYLIPQCPNPVENPPQAKSITWRLWNLWGLASKCSDFSLKATNYPTVARPGAVLTI